MDDKNDRNDTVSELYNPEEFGLNEIDELRIGSAFEHQSLNSVLILAEEPSRTQHSFACDIFGKPKLKNNEENDKFCIVPFIKKEIKDINKS